MHNQILYLLPAVIWLSPWVNKISHGGLWGSGEEGGEGVYLSVSVWNHLLSITTAVERWKMSAECVYSGFESPDICIFDWYRWAPSALTAAETSAGTVTRLETSYTSLIQIRITSGFFNCWNGFTIHGKCFCFVLFRFFKFSAFKCFQYKLLVKYLLSVLPRYYHVTDGLW